MITVTANNISTHNGTTIKVNNDIDDFPLHFYPLVCHEVKNPLTSISLALGMLHNSNIDDQQKEFLLIINRSYLRINNLMNLLIEQGLQKHTPQNTYSILQMIEEIIFDNKDIFKQNKITVCRDFTINDFAFTGEKYKIKLALSNIITNAIEAMPNGGEITVCIKQQNHKNVIEIKDSGQGISKKNLDQIFVPHFTTKPNGLGIGLALSKHILKDNNIDISVTSEENMGTNFTMHFNGENMGKILC